jgi:hypothetical protein
MAGARKHVLKSVGACGTSSGSLVAKSNVTEGSIEWSLVRDLPIYLTELSDCSFCRIHGKRITRIGVLIHQGQASRTYRVSNANSLPLRRNRNVVKSLF